MHSLSSIKTPQNQKGLALVILVVVIALAFISYIVSELSVQELKRQNDEKTFETLKKAKQALINYVVTYADLKSSARYGFLPAPEVSFFGSEGSATGNIGAQYESVIGYLPWRTLGLPHLRDDSGSCLMYAVSGDYKVASSARAEMLNEDSNGLFQVVNEAGAVVKGAQPEDRIVAIVIAPGSPLGDQDRTFDPDSICGQDYGNIAEYLEGDGTTDNAAISGTPDTIDQFINAAINSENAATPYNDRFITITRDEIWKAITIRTDFNNKITNLTEALALCIAAYGNEPGNMNRLPWPVTAAIFDYREDSSYDDGHGAYAGRLPYRVNDSNSDIVTAFSEFLLDDPVCNDLNLSIGGDKANLDIATDEYRLLWKNWKDHFFYVLSDNFRPLNAPAGNCAGDCVTVEGVEVGGIVFYGGTRQPGVARNALPDGDTKSFTALSNFISNYLENGNDAVIAAAMADGKDDAFATNTTGNDIMFCISGTLPFTVSAC